MIGICKQWEGYFSWKYKFGCYCCWNQLKLQRGCINQSQTSCINVIQFNNVLWFTFHKIFQKIIWPIWRCDSLNVHVCTPQYQCSIMIRHHILIFMSWTIILPPSS
jgi:hypothetical protein